MKRLVLALASVFLFSHCATTQTGGQQGSEPIKNVKGNFKIGVVLPLSGKFKIYGESVLHGIECAAGVVPPCTSPLHVELVVKDSHGDPATAATAVEELVKQDQVITILGPLLSKEVEAAANKAQELKIPLVSLSQKDGVTDIGDYIFRVTMSADSQVQTLVDYAVKQKGYKRFGILSPRNPYGENYRAVFSDAVTKAGGQVVAEKVYGEEVVNIVDATAQQQHDDAQKPKSGLSTDGTYHGPGAKGTSGGAEVSAGVSAKPRIPTISGVEAIFIPDSYRAIANIIKYGNSNTLSGVQLLGTNRWNESGLLDIGTPIEGAVFVDGFFAQSQDIGVQQFVDSFRQAYQLTPTILEAQGYDAIHLVMKAIENGGRKPASMRNTLAKLANFKGLTGRISFGPNRDAQKHLVLLTVSGGAIIELHK